MIASPEAPPVGAGIVHVAWAGTGLFVAAAVTGAVVPHPFRGTAVVVSALLFGVGLAAFFWAYAVAVSRSRYDDVSIGGVYFLVGSAPRLVRVRLGIALAVQIAVAAATAAFRPFTSQAFVVLAPLFGLGLMGVWGARHGEFPPRGAEPIR